MFLPKLGVGIMRIFSCYNHYIPIRYIYLSYNVHNVTLSIEITSTKKEGCETKAHHYFAYCLVIYLNE